MPQNGREPAAPDDGAIAGLSGAEAASRLAAEGYNELPAPDRRGPLRIALEVVHEPMLALLLGSVLVYFFLGDLAEALVLGVFASLSVAITVVQEARTERVLEALRELSSPRALVVRDGQRHRIAGREVVRGDVVVLSEGDRVPADGVLRRSRDLQADESLLTGESVPVAKAARTTAGGSDNPGRDTSLVFSGSLIVRGNGIATVTAIGAATEIGKIGDSLRTVDTERSPLHQQTKRLVRVFAVMAAVVSTLAIVLYGTLRGDWMDALLAGIALGMSLLPEEFPVVLTVFLAMGAWRISYARVLTRRAAAIEALGAATVLCTDKTGTLTQNRMSVAELRLGDGQVHRPDADNRPKQEFRDLVRYGVLASQRHPVDPMEGAFHEIWRRQSASSVEPADRLTLVETYAVTPQLLATSRVWKDTGAGTALVVAAKGAPEAIFSLCKRSPADTTATMLLADEMAASGLRVLGVARATFNGDELPRSQQDFSFQFLGLVGLADPIRAGVPEAMRECQSAGIRVMMVTGDYPATARAIARKIDLPSERLITSADLDSWSDEELRHQVRDSTVCARIMPQQKLRIVEALKADGEVVAMTGDGVNDAPSLKAAHIGVAMGSRGSDVAREAASLVLLDDDFSALVAAIRLGRRIYDNIRKAMGFVLAVHIPIAGLALLPLVFGLPIIFGPLHIAFLEMIIDPVCSLVFEAEAEEDDVMKRPPRPPKEPLFSRSLITWGLAQGALILALVAAVFIGALQAGMPEDEVRALTFFSLVLSFVGLIFVNRSFSASVLTALRRRNLAVLAALGAIGAACALAEGLPIARNLLQFGPLHFDDLALTIAAGVVVLIILDLIKPLWGRGLER